MIRQHLRYFESEDVLHLAITDEPEVTSVEIGPHITAELNQKGELIGIEILDATGYLRDVMLESVQARVMQLVESQPKTTS